MMSRRAPRALGANPQPPAFSAGAIAAVCLLVLTACAGGAETDTGGPAGAAGGAGATAKGAPAAVVPVSLSYADIRGVVKAIDDRKGRPVLLNFWATWCVPCIHEMPDLAKLSVEF